MTDAIKSDGTGYYFTRDPLSVLPVVFDWSAWLTAEGATTITTSTWTGTGLTLTSQAQTLTQSSVVVSGGTEGQTYSLRNTIVTANGRTDVRTMHVRVASR